VGKYNELQDAYKSIYEAFIHAGAVNECKVRVFPIHSERLESGDVVAKLKEMDGILVAPGFGERGIAGKAGSDQVRQRTQCSIFRYLPWYAMRCCRIFKKCIEYKGCRFDGSRSQHPESCYRPDGRPEKR
jgi:hypothetical protein